MFRHLFLMFFCTYFFCQNILGQKKSDIACNFFDQEHIDEILILGYHHYNEKYLEIGIGTVTGNIIYPQLGALHEATGPIWRSISMSVEFRLLDSLVIGPQLSYWSNDIFEVSGLGKFQYGCHLISYTNVNDGNLIIRPEIGLVEFFNFLPFKGGFMSLSYGYNIVVLNPDFNKINTHNLALRFYLKYR